MPPQAQTQTQHRPPNPDAFSPHDYWEQRHTTHRGSFKAVADPRLTDHDHVSQYAQKQDLILSTIKRFTHPKSITLLDAGCGIATLSKAYVDSGFHVTAVDFSKTAIEQARLREPRCQYHQANLAELDLNQTFDIISVIDVFLHIVVDDDLRTTTQNLAKHLAPNGFMIIVDWIDDKPHQSQQHCTRRSLDHYQKLVHHCRLKIALDQRFTLQREGVTKRLLVLQHDR
jgi:2-polyprenyl-3-methyl-5-hydroxy-6-metoxy-1,4-benzoquinol methylase